jgi:hypothetical protein
MVMTLVTMLGIGVYRRHDAERYAKELQNQIQLMQTVSMTKTGTRRLALYCRDNRYYCEQETESDSSNWEASGVNTDLGVEGAVTWTQENSSTTQTSESDPIMVWQFSSDTGASVDASGQTVTKVLGITAKGGKGYTVTVYGVNGYCEVERR